jgi:hypothetical protein
MKDGRIPADAIAMTVRVPDGALDPTRSGHDF